MIELMICGLFLIFSLTMLDIILIYRDYKKIIKKKQKEKKK